MSEWFVIGLLAAADVLLMAQNLYMRVRLRRYQGNWWLEDN